MLVTRKAQELDVVALAEDLPEYGLERGAHGTVVAAFDEPDEAYDLEFVDESGQSTFAYSVKPDQIIGGDEIAELMFADGLVLLEKHNIAEAEQRLKETIRLRPHYVAVLHNLLVERLGGSRDWRRLIEALRFVIRLNPDYSDGYHRLAEYLRDNLANAYNNLGVEFARKEDSFKALPLFDLALAVGPRNDIAAMVRRNIVKEYTSMGIRAYQMGEDPLIFMLRACEIESNDQARHNVGVALIHLSLKCSQKGQFDEARDAFQRAIDSGLFDSRPEILRDPGSIFQRLDETIQGLEPNPEFIPATALEQPDLRVAA